MFRDYVLLFGRILPYKGIEVLIKALRSVRESIDIHILIAGRGRISYISSLLTEEDRKNILIRNEWIPAEEIPELIKRAKFLVLPYTSASQSGIIPLSYTFAKPVIVSSVGSLREFVDHGETGFIFDVNNSMQLAHYITKLLEDDQLCIKMGIKANKKLLREMSLESSCRIMNSIYRSISPIK
jgi:glycosyltransferase involved in cell wall biosynthesis